MKVFFCITSILFGISLAGDLDLNGECDNILFAALPHPTDPNLFIGCVQGRGTVFGCNWGEVFDPVGVACVTLLTTTDDSLLTTTTTTEDDGGSTATVPTDETTFDTTTSFFSTTTRAPGDTCVRFECPISGSGFVPHQSNCSVYFECIRGVRNQRNCDPIDLHFDLISHECREPSQALCGDTIRCDCD